MNTIADKILSLEKYVEDMKTRLASPVPAKHAHRPEIFRAWLAREIKMHTTKIEDLKLLPPSKVK